jgi:hypothetical protein
MTVRYAHLAPKHTLSAVERLDVPLAVASDTTTDTSPRGHVENEAGILQ